MRNVLLFLAAGQMLDAATFTVVYNSYPGILIAEVFPFVPLAVAMWGIAALWFIKGFVTASMAYVYPRARKKARWADPALVFIAATGYVGAAANVFAYLTLRGIS